jgi:hypothetical protein
MRFNQASLTCGRPQAFRPRASPRAAVLLRLGGALSGLLKYRSMQPRRDRLFFSVREGELNPLDHGRRRRNEPAGAVERRKDNLRGAVQGSQVRVWEARNL